MKSILVVKKVLPLVLMAWTLSCNDPSGAEGIAKEEHDSTTAAPAASPAPSDLKADTINNPQPAKPSQDGSIHLTAQNGKGVGPDIKYMPEWRAFGWFTAADRVEWQLEGVSPGEYEVFLEWSVDDLEAGKEFILEAGAQHLTGIVAKSGSWETYKTANVGRIKLDKDLQTVIFRSNQKFDKGAILDLREISLVAVK